jgi:uncharacterized protein (TIGR00725 family)
MSTLMARLVIGVVGTSDPKKIPPRQAELAKQVGQEIRKRGHILLTGGQPNERKETIKKLAMQGSLFDVPVDERGRAVGILRGAKKPENTKDQGCRDHYEATDLGNDRNLLNGVTPNALIAMFGGPGTLSEILYAYLSNRPIVFLESIQQLITTFEMRPSKFKDIVDSVRNTFYDLEVAGSAQEMVEDKMRSLFSNRANCASTAAEAVEKVISAVPKNAYGSNYPNAARAPSKEIFDRKLKWIAEDF